MNIIGKQKIAKFQKKHSDSRRPINNWLNILENSNFKNSVELKNSFPSVNCIGNDRYIFDIKGNHYRAVCIVFFIDNEIIIEEILTHAEYDKKNY